jgi:hypothetical protein
MNGNEAMGESKHRTKRVVSLPCGHQLHVGLDASLLAVSGPVLDHQSTCRPEKSVSLPAWSPVEGSPSADRDVLGGIRHPLLWGLFL